MPRRTIRVHGDVQGVYYRDSTRQQAASLGLTGFVRNEQDGSVYIEAQGEVEGIDELTQWAHDGPDGASVNDVRTDEIEPRGNESDFIVR